MHRDMVREYAFRVKAVREYGSTRSASTPYAFRVKAVKDLLTLASPLTPRRMSLLRSCLLCSRSFT
jgi:hypothetical protein